MTTVPEGPGPELTELKGASPPRVQGHKPEYSYPILDLQPSTSAFIEAHWNR
jgi:hypothetical protein